MIKEIQSYHKWLEEKTNCSEVGRTEWVEIETPYLDRHNDSIVIYFKKIGGGYLLTDDGSAIDDLSQSGNYAPNTEAQIQAVLRGFGAKLVGAEIQIDVPDPDNFPLRMHNLIQAILAVNWGIGWANR